MGKVKNKENREQKEFFKRFWPVGLGISLAIFFPSLIGLIVIMVIIIYIVYIIFYNITEKKQRNKLHSHPRMAIGVL